MIINDRVAIASDEISFVASRSAGPGGQHVNKVNSRVTLVFDLSSSRSLSDEDKERLRQRLPTRINKLGELRVSAQRERSQVLNRRRASERFVELIRDALEDAPERKATRVPRRAKRRRLSDKRRRSETKRGRRPRFDDD